MFRNRCLFVRLGPTLVAAILSAAACADEWADAVAQVRAVPRHHQWTLIDPAQRPVLKKLVEMPAAQRAELLGSPDARQRGIGIFVAGQQGDLGTLLSLSALLDDAAPTVPYALPVAHGGDYPVREQTVADYLTSVYQEWFGVDVDNSRARFDDLLSAGKAKPEEFVHPWIVRLRRAQPNAQAVAQLKERVAALPEEVRWAVVTLGYSNSLYTKADARTLLTKLSESTRAALRRPDTMLPNEPLLRSTSFRDAVLRAYEELSQS